MPLRPDVDHDVISDGLNGRQGLSTQPSTPALTMSSRYLRWEAGGWPVNIYF